jgi:hypothetical protein
MIDIGDSQAISSRILRQATGAYSGSPRLGEYETLRKVNLIGRDFQWSDGYWNAHGTIGPDGNTVTIQWHCLDGSFPDKTEVYQRH